MREEEALKKKEEKRKERERKKKEEYYEDQKAKVFVLDMGRCTMQMMNRIKKIKVILSAMERQNSSLSRCLR